MAEFWKQWRGQLVNEKFPLLQYLCGSDQCAVFLTSANQQKAAIKLIPVSASDSSDHLQRWQGAAKLSHPHLLKLLDGGKWTKNGHTFLYAVMEFAEEDLSQILPQRPLSAREARDLLPPVLEVLTYLHQKNFVHGHLKPSNILASGDQLKISSDGLHKTGDLVHSSSTPSVYLPPEVDNEGLTPASDVWSLGVVLLEALTQRAPVWTDKQSDPKIPASVADPFREIAANCLRRDPTQRWTIRQIGSALNPSAPIPEPQKPVMVGEKTPVPARSRRLAFPVVAGAVVILAAILAAKFAGHSQSPTDTATTQTTVAQPQTGQSESLQQTASAQPIAETKAGVSTSSGSSTGEVLKQVVPDVPRSARNTIHGTVKVAVLASVDTSGNVSSTKFERRGPSEYFANLAMKAAREWKFKSPQVNGREVASAWSLQFDFRRSGTTAHPTRKNP